MDFWNDDIVFVTYDIKNRPPSNEVFNNKMCQNFIKTINYDCLEFNLWCILSFLIIYSSFQIEISKFSHDGSFYNHMFSDIYRVAYQYFWRKVQGIIIRFIV